MNVAPGHNPHEKHRLTFVVVPLVALAAVGAWFWQSRSGANAAAPSTTPVRSVVHLETFVLNLSGSEDRAYLRAGVDLGVRAEAPG
ncbi:MAG TPA: hypothetical protein VK466_17660, partial [Terriglobales bacterium]|nr:hypothetical protein [Terriglobales bacterium]